ncbi:MAG TPA: SurA N-terminal domain-containing protein [Bacteroidales bacterium]|nr:SurA N-terminal domain-containing protein [Bacteroidales bacterium]
MAIIGEIRKHYWLLVLIIGVALLLFIVSDFSRRSSKHTNTIGVVAGEKISVVDFNKRVDENIEIQKMSSKKENLTSEENYQIRQSTWNQMVNEIVMDKQREKLGVSVSLDELDDMIRGKNPHQYIVQSFTDPNTGRFDQKAVNNFLQNLDNEEMVSPEMKQRYLMMEKAIKNDRLNTKYNSLITKGFYLPTAFAKRTYQESNEMANVLITGVRYSVIGDSAVKVTDADYQKYYDENKYKFQQETPARDLEYVVFSVTPSQSDMAALQQDMEKLKAEFAGATDNAAFVGSNSDNRYDSSWHKKGTLSFQIDSLVFNAPAGVVIGPVMDNNMYRLFKVTDREMRPDSLKASHILISYAGSQVQNATRSKERASKLADSVLNVVKSNPAMFEVLGGSLSDDDYSKKKQGDLGWFADGAMVPEFNSAVLKGNIGDIKKVETVFGYHIIKITGKKDPTLKIRFASVDRAIEASSKTSEAIYNQASEFAAQNNTIEKFEKTVKDKGLDMRKAERLDAMSNQIPGVTSAREVVRWAFNKDTEKGAVSNVFDVDGSYVVATLKSTIDKGYIPLEVLKDPIKPLVLREKKAQTIIEKLNSQLSGNKDINRIASVFPSTVDTADVSFASCNIPNYGHEAKVTGKIFSAPKSQLTGPIQGEQAVYMFVLKDLKAAPATKDYENQKRQMAMYFQSRINNVPDILERKANIKDNRSLFY